MKHSILMAVAGGLLANTVSHNNHDKKNDLFYKADRKAHKCCVNVKNVNADDLKFFRYQA